VVALDPDTGEGLARADGARVFVAGALPGERVRAAAERGGRGRLLRVLDPSPERVAPRCRHAGECGGCAWQHLAYPAQLREKRARVAAALRAALGREVAVRDTLGLAPGPPPPGDAPAGADPLAPWGFRDKVHFVLGPGPGGLAVGHYRRGTQALLPLEECPVHAPEGNRLAFRAAELLRRTLQGVARHLVVRVGEGTGQALLTLVATRERVERLKEWVAGLREGPCAPDGLHLDVHAGASPYLFGREGRKLFGRARLMEELLGTRWLVSPTAFFQTSARGAALLVREVLARVPADGPVLDLFAGAGLFALPLARRGQRVLAVEENAAAVADGVASRELNQLAAASCRFVSARVEELLPRLVAEQAAGAPRFAAVVLDPPRDGCPPGTLEAVRRLGAVPLVYVSCHPEALARDVALAARLGWEARDVQPIDMFPHTPHVETVVTLTPARTREPPRAAAV
jgi:23S rRNA (uracil1939-C5)-methyltransferase